VLLQNYAERTNQRFVEVRSSVKQAIKTNQACELEWEYAHL